MVYKVEDNNMRKTYNTALAHYDVHTLGVIRLDILRISATMLAITTKNSIPTQNGYRLETT